MTLHPYIGYAGDPAEGALLVFAPTARAARPIAWCGVSSWCSDIEYPDVRVRRMRQHVDYLMTLADPDKLEAGLPHYIDELPSCKTCEHWGSPLDSDGQCPACESEHIEFDDTPTSRCFA